MQFIILGYNIFFTWYDIFYWIFTVFAVWGVWLNAELDRRCFYIWMFTNAAFTVETFLLGGYNMTILFMIYFILAIKGIKNNKWQKV